MNRPAKLNSLSLALLADLADAARAIAADPTIRAAVLTGAGATLENASDAVVYDFDIPGSILDGNRQKRPRTHPAVIQVLNRRRQRGHQALQAFQQAGP